MYVLRFTLFMKNDILPSGAQVLSFSSVPELGCRQQEVSTCMREKLFQNMWPKWVCMEAITTLILFLEVCRIIFTSLKFRRCNPKVNWDSSVNYAPGSSIQSNLKYISLQIIHTHCVLLWLKIIQWMKLPELHNINQSILLYLSFSTWHSLFSSGFGNPDVFHFQISIQASPCHFSVRTWALPISKVSSISKALRQIICIVWYFWRKMYSTVTRDSRRIPGIGDVFLYCY